MVTTAGETLVTRSAYEVCTLATPAAAGVDAGCVVALFITFWALMEAKEKTRRTRLKTRFVRETVLLYIFMSFIPKNLRFGGCIRYGFMIPISPVPFTATESAIKQPRIYADERRSAFIRVNLRPALLLEIV
jgi:peroxiredoxin family protein